jgi:7,8-dihydropterin-6-yl-methyl-4-(beta-D-ribofuranosyl)aminobenzene 5'-phosphate synthase
MKITVLIENKENSSFIYEHGLSLLIEADDKKILFDTGSTDKFLLNAQKSNTDLSDIDFVCLSHAHYDHTGGLLTFIKETNYKNKIYVGNSFNNNKYKFENNKYSYLGTPFKTNEIKNLIFVNKLITINNVYLMNNFTQNNDFEKVDSKFFVLNRNYEKDIFTDELVLAIDSNNGLILIVGCAHVGICNIIDETIKRLNKRVKAVIGGFHLSKKNIDNVLKTVDYLKKYNLEFISPLHCSGNEDIFTKTFQDKCKILKSGDSLIFN